jgi:hypothetical protein
VLKLNRKDFVRLGLAGAVGAGGLALAGPGVQPVRAAKAARPGRRRRAENEHLSLEERVQRLRDKLEKMGQRMERIEKAEGRLDDSERSASSSDIISSLQAVKDEANEIAAKAKALIDKLQ